MIKFTKPENLNGSELRDELRKAGVLISDDPFSVQLSENDLFLEIDDTDETKASKVVAAHNGKTEFVEASIQDKLASVGLSLDDLKVALGI